MESKKRPRSDISKKDEVFVPDEKKTTQLEGTLQKYSAPLIEKDGFIRAFDVDSETVEMKQFFADYGFVCVKNVIDAGDCERTVNSIYNFFESSGLGIKRNDWSTWKNAAMPDGLGLGMIGGYIVKGENPRMLERPDYLSHSQEAWNNRTAPKVYKAFSTLLNETDLLCSFDRFAFMRPVLKKPKGSKDEWKTKKKWLHWDQDLQTEPDFVRVQGVLALADTTVREGGLQLVPGCHHIFKEWANLYKDSLNKNYVEMIPENNFLWKYVQKVPMRRGTICVWDSRLAHSNFPNESEHPRIAQYITMYRNNLDQNAEYREIRLKGFQNGLRISHKEAVAHSFYAGRWVRPSCENATRETFVPPKLTDLGKRLLGEESFKENK
eukprot:TRINITY_DN5966_c0_g1_i1.p1 TRINITY_DN5966_c0_g1~~TRINITY_DN5966_c0_g1_i1.p1  ORF type:complete len:380 (-),score=76.73 TRINITY_DN5966_c0_g1_i1:51-1190(-)